MPLTLRNLGRLFGVCAAILTTACGTSARQLELAQAKARPDRAIIVFSLQVPEGEEVVGRPGGQPPPLYGLDLDRYDLAQQAMVGGCFSRRDVVQAQIPNRPGEPVYFAFDVPAGAYVMSPSIPHAELRDKAWIVPKGSVTYIGAFSRRTAEPHQLDFNAETDHADDLENARRQTGLDLARAEVVAVIPPRPYLCTP